MIDYRIKSREGYTDKIGDLVSMLEHAREVTLADLSGLNQSDLDYLTDENANSIGALLKHIASIEFVYQRISFEDRDINDEERETWLTPILLGDKAREEIKNNPLEYYVDELASIREKTLQLLKTKTDDWLYEDKQWGYNNYWIWYHVMEDELNHRGQIRTIKRILSKNKEASTVD